jgi:hypothetical protein
MSESARPRGLRRLYLRLSLDPDYHRVVWISAFAGAVVMGVVVRQLNDATIDLSIAMGVAFFVVVGLVATAAIRSIPRERRVADSERARQALEGVGDYAGLSPRASWRSRGLRFLPIQFILAVALVIAFLYRSSVAGAVSWLILLVANGAVFWLSQRE